MAHNVHQPFHQVLDREQSGNRFPRLVFAPISSSWPSFRRFFC